MGIIDRLKEIFPKTITGRQGPDVIPDRHPDRNLCERACNLHSDIADRQAISQSEIKVYKSGKPYRMKIITP